MSYGTAGALDVIQMAAKMAAILDFTKSRKKKKLQIYFARVVKMPCQNACLENLSMRSRYLLW